nr:MAG TPA: tail tape measure protein [Caudoviricetes sp.]
MSASDSASFIIAQMKAFGIEAGNAEHIIDAVNAVSNNYAVSSGQLAKNLGNMSAALSVGNNSFEESLGLLTAGTEVTRNASKVSRALVSVQSRLNQVIDESSSTGQALTDWYKKHNIAILDQQGQLRSLYDVLTDVAEIWPTLTKNEQAYYLNQQAGANQSQNLAAILSNFDTATKATATALNSAGSAMRENEAFQESLEYQTNNLKATFQDLANNVIDKELISSVLKLGDAFLKLANTDIGVLVTKIGLLTGAGWGLSSLVQVSKIIPTIVGQFQNFGAVLSLVAEGSGTFGAALSAAGGAGAVALPIFLAVSAAIVGIVEAVKAYKASHPDFDTAAQSVSTLSDSLKTAQDRLDEINKLGWKDRTRAINDEEQELKDLIAQQERELQVAQMRQAMAAGEELSERTGYGKATRYTAISPNDTDNQTFASMDEAVKSLAETEGITGESTDELKQKLLDLGYAFVTTTENTKLTADEMNALDTQALQELSGSIKDNGELNTYLKDSYQGLYEELAPTYEKLVNLENAQKNAIPGARELTDSERELKGAFEQLVVTMLSFESSGDNAYQTIANLANILGVTPAYARDLAISMGLIDANTRPAAGALVQLENGTWAVADGLNAVKTASDGVGEAMSNISVATYDTSTAAAQLTASLFDQNGQLTEAGLQALSVDSSMRSMAQAELQAQQEAAQASYSKLILEIQKVGSAAMITAGQLSQMMALAGVGSAQGLVGGLASGASTDIEGLKSAFFRSFGKSADANVADFNKWVSSRISSAGQTTYDKIMEETQKRLDELEKNFPSGGGGGGGSSKKSAEEKAAEEAEKQAKKAQKAQENAAKESQQAYESAASSAEQAARQAAQAAEQAAEEAKQKILDSIQELKDASDKFWDSKTDAIEETNKELDRQKQLEEKLKALEEAKQKKILLYKNGQFQYDKDYGTIAKAQADYEETRDKIQRERELEQLEEMKDNATEIFNEMKDIVQNGGNVTQEMINNWLKNMAASGADYYDSNKKLLNEWLDWAKNALQTYGQGVVDAVNGYVSTSSLMSSGTYGSNAQGMVATDTNGARYLADRNSDNPLYWDKDGNFVGFTKAFWIDVFDAQIKKGQLGDYTKTDAWLGNMPGTSVFDNWKEVFEYWAKQPDADIYALQDMVDRFDAAKKVFNYYEDIFKSLGYDEYAKMAEQYKNVDTGEYWTMARKMMVAANPTDPSGERKNIPAWRGTRIEDSAELYRVAMDLLYDFMGLNKTDADKWKNQFTDTALGEFFDTAKRDYHINREDESDRYEYATFDTEALKKALDENEEALKLLSEKWFEAATDLDRQVIAAEAESRRKFRDLGYAQLGMDTTAQSEAERAANRQPSGKTLDEARRDKKLANNVDDINKTLEKIENGQAISQGYITKASDYISKMIEENSEKWFTLYDQTEKDKLHQQTEELRALQEKLQKANDLAEINNLLVHGEGLLPNEKADFEDEDWKDRKKYDDWVREAEDLDDTAEVIRRQMELNAQRWFDADEKTKDELHRANEELAERLTKETGTNLSYSGETGKWSKNATGTRNFRGGLSLVGERGPEMRILGQGDNIIPANQTANLWKWSNTTPQQMLTTLSARSGGGNTSYAFDVSRIELPNVTDAKSFVHGLKNYALQYSYKR